MGALFLLVLGAASVGVVHSVLPDHWVPLAVVARTQKWSILRLARTSFLAATGHVLTSLVLGAVVGLVGLQFQKQIETQQGHIVGGVLVLTGVGFLVWGLTGHGHPHEHGTNSEEVEQLQTHDHEPERGVAITADHTHEHGHGTVRHSHRHRHEAFIRTRADLIADHSSRGTIAGQLSAIAVPFGVAASPDLTFLPFAIAASAYGLGSVATVLGVFSIVTLTTFVGLTVVATAVGYQMRGEWLEKNANTITAVVLIVIGVLAYVGF